MLNTPVVEHPEVLEQSAKFEKTYVYCFIRGDLPLHQQMVQIAHAALEAGRKHPQSERTEPSSLIAIKLKNKRELESAFARLSDAQVDCTLFFEPDWDYGHTAFATRPVLNCERHLFKRYQLWKP